MQISKSLRQKWGVLVQEKIGPSAPQIGTILKVIDQFFITKLPYATRYITRQPVKRNPIVLCDKTFLFHSGVVLSVKGILQNDITDFQLSSSPVKLSITKAMLEIYNEEMENRGQHFNLNSTDRTSSIPKGFKFWVFSPTPEQANKKILEFKNLWRDAAVELSSRDVFRQKILTKTGASLALNIIFSNFSRLDESDFFKEDNVGKLRNSFCIEGARAKGVKKMALGYIEKVYDGFITQTPQFRSVRGPK